MSDVPSELGVTVAGDGVDVAIVSQAADGIDLCLFDDSGAERRLPLTERTGDVFHAHVPGVTAGTRYGLRAHGAWDPPSGRRFNPAKLLIDPHAVALDRVCRLHPSMYGHQAGNPAARDETDSAPFVPHGTVTAPADLAPIVRPDWSWSRTVIYELHVRGFTMRHPQIPPEIRGTFAALAHPVSIAHLTALGVTTVEVMPANAWVEERHLAALGLTNYWGYNPIAYLAPDKRLAPGGWPEVRGAVAALAEAGIETILDVVLNHTGEGDALGPTLSLRGLDNALYYRLLEDRAAYVDDTGTGNTMALNRPHVLRLAMDSLRTCVKLGGFHGFRFDLGTVLGRGESGFDPASPLLSAISQDPLLRTTKLISEPWDVGWGGYQVGSFPGQWGEWNDRFRDDVRKFWRGDGSLGALATRLAGSADVFAAHRRPSRGVNFVVAHDGFTLADLVSYQDKHNDANGEGNRDGTSDNTSWNNGIEGPTTDPAITAARLRDQTAMLATLLLSRGTPMFSMGSEMGHSQGGNNNAYCQDTAIAWLDWGSADLALLAAARALVAARQTHPALTEDRFLSGTGDPPDVQWLRADGAVMTPDDWNAPGAGTLVMLLADAPDRVAVVIHRGNAPQSLRLPQAPPGRAWRNVLAAADGSVVPGRAVALFAEAAAA